MLGSYFYVIGISYDKMHFTCNWIVSKCRHCILYPLQLGPPFSNDGSTLKPKVGLGPNQMKIDLKKVFVENITYFWKNKNIFGKERPQETLSVHTHTCVCICTLKPYICMLIAWAHMHGHVYATRVPKTM